jgi:hypothetical protein
MTDTSTALRECLLILAELKEECGLDLQLGKCKLYIKCRSLAGAGALVRSIINAEPGLSSISEMLQVHGTSPKMSSKWTASRALACLPIGSPAFVRAFVKAQTSAMVDDVKKLRVLSDPLTHTRLIRFCHNTRLLYIMLSRSLAPDVMRNQACGLQTVDQAMAMEVLRRGTDLGSPD